MKQECQPVVCSSSNFRHTLCRAEKISAGDRARCVLVAGVCSGYRQFVMWTREQSGQPFGYTNKRSRQRVTTKWHWGLIGNHPYHVCHFECEIVTTTQRRVLILCIMLAVSTLPGSSCKFPQFRGCRHLCEVNSLLGSENKAASFNSQYSYHF